MTAMSMGGYDFWKIARVHAAAHHVLGELHDGRLDDPSRHRLEALTLQTLIELGSAVPPELLTELGRFVRPGPGGHASDDELRVVWAQILGWTSGLPWPQPTLYELTAGGAQLVDADSTTAELKESSPSPYL